MTNDLQPYLTVRVDPADMVQYVHNLMSIPSGAASEASVALAQRQWGGDTPLARAAHMRWSALNRAFGDARVSSWTTPRKSRPNSRAGGAHRRGRRGAAHGGRG